MLVGFAAETDDLLRKAREKRLRKAVDLIVANDVSQPDRGFDVETNRVLLLDASGDVEELPLLSKEDVAERLCDWIVGHRQPRRRAQARTKGARRSDAG